MQRAVIRCCAGSGCGIAARWVGMRQEYLPPPTPKDEARPSSGAEDQEREQLPPPSLTPPFSQLRHIVLRALDESPKTRITLPAAADLADACLGNLGASPWREGREERAQVFHPPPPPPPPPPPLPLPRRTRTSARIDQCSFLKVEHSLSHSEESFSHSS